MTTRKRKARPLSDEIRALDQELASRMQYNQLEHRCLLVENEYQKLRDRLVSLLLPDQIEAAKTCGVTPEMYALEWIDIHFRGKMEQIAPGYLAYVKSLHEIKNGAI